MFALVYPPQTRYNSSTYYEYIKDKSFSRIGLTSHIGAHPPNFNLSARTEFTLANVFHEYICFLNAKTHTHTHIHFHQFEIPPNHT